MSRTYSVTEPHPSVAKAGYIGSGRGGAGNYKHYTTSEVTSGPTATGPAARVKLSRPAAPSRNMTSGRGGAGNMHKPRATSPEPKIFLFDEELVRKRESSAPMYHIGRGGAANWIDETKSVRGQMRRGSDSESVSSDRSSASSVRRSMSGALQTLTRRISKQ